MADSSGASAPRELSFKERRNLKSRSHYLEGVVAGHCSGLFSPSSNNVKLVSWINRDWSPGFEPVQKTEPNISKRRKMDGETDKIKQPQVEEEMDSKESTKGKVHLFIIFFS